MAITIKKIKEVARRRDDIRRKRNSVIIQNMGDRELWRYRDNLRASEAMGIQGEITANRVQLIIDLRKRNRL
jgi:hypothetical protein